mmetsp:Transcript_130347/g.325158  ORF Transcript_130347/g.325158 Transcript_130347/m.325158 type:complete len:334 (+) Transcript_130347:63-1064(+)
MSCSQADRVAMASLRGELTNGIAQLLDRHLKPTSDHRFSITGAHTCMQGQGINLGQFGTCSSAADLPLPPPPNEVPLPMWHKNAKANGSDALSPGGHFDFDKDTLVVLVGIQPNRTLQDLERMIYSFGVKGSLDFVIGPVRWNVDCLSSLAFIKFTSVESARKFVGTIQERCAQSKLRAQHFRVTEDVLHTDSCVASNQTRGRQFGLGAKKNVAVRRASAQVLKEEMFSGGGKAGSEEGLLAQSLIVAPPPGLCGDAAHRSSMDLQSLSEASDISSFSAVTERREADASSVQYKVRLCASCKDRTGRSNYAFCPSCGCRFQGSCSEASLGTTF